MRLVFDTHVLIAAFISRGHCHDLLEHATRSHEILISEFILGAFRSKLTGKFGMSVDLVEPAVDLQRSRMQIVEPDPLLAPVARDPDDDWILATGLAAAADCLVTGDSDLRDLGDHAGMPILLPASFWAFEAEFTRGS